MGQKADFAYWGNQPTLSEEDALIRSAIITLDYKPIVRELCRRNIFTAEQADEVFPYYQMHLFLAAKYPSVRYVPSDQVAAFVHTHVLDTEKYARDCERICGRLIHHGYEPVPESPVYKELAQLWQYAIKNQWGEAPDWFSYSGEELLPINVMTQLLTLTLIETGDGVAGE